MNETDEPSGSKRKGHAGGRKQVEDEPATKKIAQQREASRKYRERKEQYVKDLELAVAELSKQGSKPTEELRNRIAALEAENSMLRQVTFSFDPLQATVDLLPATHQQHVSTAAGGQLPIATEDLFASSDFTAPHIHFDTFKQTHVDINFESLFSETELSDILTSSSSSPNNNNQASKSTTQPVWTPTQVIEKLVNTPLPTPPSDDQVIEPHFSGARRALEKLPSLQSALNLVDELIKLYCAFVNYKTGTEPVTCRYTFGLIKVTEGRILEQCSTGGIAADMDVCVFVFEAVKRKYFIIDRPNDDHSLGYSLQGCKE